MNGPFDICFVGLKCYDLLANRPTPKYLGGIEKVLVALAKALARSGASVAFVTYDEGQPDIEVHDGVSVLKAQNATAGLPLLRLLHPRMTLMWRAMRKANASCYFQMGRGVETFATAVGVRLSAGKPAFVYCVASDLDCQSDLAGLTTFHERVLYRVGLRMATRIVVQTRRQAAMLEENHSLLSEVIPMPIEASSTDADTDVRRLRHSSSILWIGRTVPVKRLEWLLDLAEILQDFTFDVVGTANQESDYASALVVRARSIANVRVHGRVSAEQLERLYADAFLLCCTSSFEGFPTTFLEAWKQSLPVVTSFDPDHQVSEYDVGVAANSVKEMSEAIRWLRVEPSIYAQKSSNAQALYKRSYAPEAIVAKYQDLVRKLATR